MAITELGARLAEMTIPVGAKGYRDLETWARSLGTVRAFGVEGSGSYGAGLSRFLCERGHAVLEVGRPNRQLRHRHGKTDHLDAEAAARAVLGGEANALPKSGTSTVEMIRHFKVARDTAVKARTQAMLTLKALVIAAPIALRDQLDAITGNMALVRHLTALRPGPIISTTASAKAGLRALARRWLALDEEIKVHDVQLQQLTTQCAPKLVQAHGIKANTAAEMLLLVGDNPERIRSEAALRSCAALAPSRHRAGRPAVTVSTAAGTAKPMLPYIVSSLCECAPTSPPGTTSGDARPRGRANPRSSAASNVSSSARSSDISAASR